MPALARFPVEFLVYCIDSCLRRSASLNDSFTSGLRKAGDSDLAGSSPSPAVAACFLVCFLALRRFGTVSDSLLVAWDLTRIAARQNAPACRTVGLGLSITFHN